MPDLYAVADFCLIPIGTANTSVAEEVAECQRVLEKSGLKYKHINVVTSISTTPTSLVAVATALTSVSCLLLEMNAFDSFAEGPWSAVSQAIHDCHAAVHAKGALRIATDIRIGTRVDREIAPGEGNDGKVKRVEEILAKDHA
ncbi:hypothetical protein BDQ12DRAFT_719358 [Crucibulum laeve]|uniref:Thiamine-binding protein domain-containing protein n=1 Tax=Crucibulum laeve TaxID=68775 RepID=A0A5C3MCT8_9AGAR|nr:hypothetical protein BDQ12DRAFT_719358 [Crucibulum laeve]